MDATGTSSPRDTLSVVRVPAREKEVALVNTFVVGSVKLLRVHPIGTNASLKRPRPVTAIVGGARVIPCWILERDGTSISIRLDELSKVWERRWLRPGGNVPRIVDRPFPAIVGGSRVVDGRTIKLFISSCVIGLEGSNTEGRSLAEDSPQSKVEVLDLINQTNSLKIKIKQLKFLVKIKQFNLIKIEALN